MTVSAVPSQTGPVTALDELLRSMSPRLNAGVYVYARVPHEAAIPASTLMMMREHEATTLIVPEHEASALGISPMFRCEWITLEVNSALEAVGLTAAFARALGEANISCNVVAGADHDHIFVPAGEGDNALAVLQALQQRSA
ncbi:ACT domain-containing protein [Pokkaliibacter sp. CJK22405]|uniref:ACT domain-containing protein n=1 Tax=Pokkaliibacter sp. CJK22405 TaxID=3384615 RepID=UPI00398496A1